MDHTLYECLPDQCVVCDRFDCERCSVGVNTPLDTKEKVLLFIRLREENVIRQHRDKIRKIDDELEQIRAERNNIKLENST